jgi:hypothetical protein
LPKWGAEARLVHVVLPHAVPAHVTQEQRVDRQMS